MLKKLYAFLFLFVVSVSAVQADDSGFASLKKLDYSKVDSFVMNLPDREYKSVEELATVLTSPFQNDAEKFRAMFMWIAENVTYDCDAYHYTEKFNRHIKFYNVLRKAVSDSFVENIYNRNVKITPLDVIQRRTAICSGYANLLEELGDAAGVPVEKVRGYVKSSPNEISSNMNVIAHAWNVVRLNGKWYPVDITWASGYTTGNCDSYVKEFSESYYIQSPEQFIKNHYPRKKEWQLVEQPITLKQFCEMPNVLEGYFKNDLDCSTSQSGLLNVKMNESVKITFRSDKELTEENVGLYLDSYTCDEGSYTLKKGDDNNYTVEFKPKKKGESVATIVVNKAAAIQYKVIAR